jgi:hypothetical protein
MKILSRLFVSALVALACGTASSAVFVVAHPDDLTFLMGGNTITDIKGGYPTLVVILSAEREFAK